MKLFSPSMRFKLIPRSLTDLTLRANSLSNKFLGLINVTSSETCEIDVRMFQSFNVA